MEIINFRKYENETLQGYADIYMEAWKGDLIGCSLHKKGNATWVNLPSKDFTNSLGEKRYSNIFKFRDQEHTKEFSRQAVAAISEYREKNEI